MNGKEKKDLSSFDKLEFPLFRESVRIQREAARKRLEENKVVRTLSFSSRSLSHELITPTPECLSSLSEAVFPSK